MASGWLGALELTHFAGEVEQRRAQRKPPETGEAVRAAVIAENKPARLMAIIPADLPAGSWYIEVKTKYANATKQLKTLKSGRFGKALTRSS